MSNHPCGLCGTLHFNSTCPDTWAALREPGTWAPEEQPQDHDNYAFVVCHPKRGCTAKDVDGCW